jgi:ABC-type Fe3+-siderophore transport system permease subunit
MTLALLQVMVQSVSSTLHWIGLCVGIRALPNKTQQWRWIIGSAVLFAAWLFAIVLMASDNFFRNDVLPPRIPIALLVTLAAGYLLLVSRTVRGIIAGIPRHW